MNKRIKNKHENMYLKQRVFHHLSELTKQGLTIQNITYPRGYFHLRTDLKYRIVHFEIAEISLVKFGLWITTDRHEWLFAEHLATFDKFKPSAATWSPCYEGVTYDENDRVIPKTNIDWASIYDRISEMVDNPHYIFGKTDGDKQDYENLLERYAIKQEENRTFTSHIHAYLKTLLSKYDEIEMIIYDEYYEKYAVIMSDLNDELEEVIQQDISSFSDSLNKQYTHRYDLELDDYNFDFYEVKSKDVYKNNAKKFRRLGVFLSHCGNHLKFYRR